jgi:hypothetical protein
MATCYSLYSLSWSYSEKRYLQHCCTGCKESWAPANIPFLFQEPIVNYSQRSNLNKVQPCRCASWSNPMTEMSPLQHPNTGNHGYTSHASQLTRQSEPLRISSVLLRLCWTLAITYSTDLRGSLLHWHDARTTQGTARDVRPAVILEFWQTSRYYSWGRFVTPHASLDAQPTDVCASNISNSPL